MSNDTMPRAGKCNGCAAPGVLPGAKHCEGREMGCACSCRKERGDCCICGKETELYCRSCADGWGKTWYCSDHYETTVMTGNCCRGNEIAHESY